jgi:hypothetical protein
MSLRFRRIDQDHWQLDFGGYPLREALLRAAQLSFETAPVLRRGLAADPLTPAFEPYLVEEASGQLRALSLLRASGRNCQTYIFRKGEVWWFNGAIFARRGERAFVPPDRDVGVDPEKFLQDLAVYLDIDDVLRGFD